MRLLGVTRNVDCPTCAGAALHVYRSGAADSDSGAGRHSAHSHRHFSQHRYPGDRRGLQLHRPERRGDGRAHHLHLRALAHHHGQRYRAHGIAIHRRARHHQGLLPAGRRYQRRGGAGERHFAAHPAAVAAGHHAAVPAHLQRLQRAHRATRPLRARTERTGAVRLRRQLHPHAPGDHSRLRHPVSVRRQAAPDHGGYQSRGDAVQGAFAGRCHQCHRQPEPHHPGRHFEDRAVRIRRGSEFQPHHGGGVQRLSHQGGERHAGLHPRYRPRARRLRAADQYRAAGWQPRRAAHRDEGRQRFHAGGGGRRPQAAAGGGRHAAAGIEDSAAGRSIDFRARFHQRRDPRSGDRRLPHRA